MRDDSVKRFINNIPEGAVFCISDIGTDGSTYESVKTQLSRACAVGTIVRITRGIYHKPKFSKIINDYVPYRTEDAAYAISRMNGWRIIPSGNSCLNAIGLSTQVPAKYIFYSNGPNHTYDLNGTIIDFKHRSPRNFPTSERSAIIVQAIKAKGKDNCDHNFIDFLSGYISIEGQGALIEETCTATAWVRDIIKEACLQ